MCNSLTARQFLSNGSLLIGDLCSGDGRSFGFGSVPLIMQVESVTYRPYREDVVCLLDDNPPLYRTVLSLQRFR